MTAAELERALRELNDRAHSGCGSPMSTLDVIRAAAELGRRAGLEQAAVAAHAHGNYTGTSVGVEIAMRIRALAEVKP